MVPKLEDVRNGSRRFSLRSVVAKAAISLSLSCAVCLRGLDSVLIFAECDERAKVLGICARKTYLTQRKPLGRAN